MINISDNLKRTIWKVGFLYPVFEQWAGQGVAMCLTSCRLVNLHAENADSHAQCNFFPPTYCNASGDNLQECDNYFEQEQCSTVKKKKKVEHAAFFCTENAGNAIQTRFRCTVPLWARKPKPKKRIEKCSAKQNTFKCTSTACKHAVKNTVVCSFWCEWALKVLKCYFVSF